MTHAQQTLILRRREEKTTPELLAWAVVLHLQYSSIAKKKIKGKKKKINAKKPYKPRIKQHKTALPVPARPPLPCVDTSCAGDQSNLAVPQAPRASFIPPVPTPRALILLPNEPELLHLGPAALRAAFPRASAFPCLPGCWETSAQGCVVAFYIFPSVSYENQ